MKKKGRLLLMTLILFGLNACSSLAPTQSGFLVSPQEGDGVTHQKERCQSCESLAPYSGLIIEPVRLLPVRDDLNRQQWIAYQQLADQFEQHLQSDLNPIFSNKRSSTTRTLRLNAVITDVKASRPVINILSSIFLFIPVDRGGVSVEMELQDADNGKILMQTSRSVNGTIGQFRESFHRYGHAEHGLKTLSRELAEQLQASTSIAAKLAHTEQR